MRKRKKSWDEKVEIVRNSFQRSANDSQFGRKFYENFFFLNPKIKEYFTNTDFERQEKALMDGLRFLLGYLDKTDSHARSQVIRIAKTHSKDNMNIHPHHYYYWMDALVMTAKKCDYLWEHNFEFYWREVFSLPVFFIISQHYVKHD